MEGDTWRGWEIPREASSFPPSHLPRAPPTGLAPRCQWDHSQTWPSEGARAAVPRSPAAEGTGASCLGGEQPCLGASKTKPCWAARAKAVAGTLRTSRLPGGGVRRAHGERGAVPVSVLGRPSLGETHGECGTEPPSPTGEGYRDARLGLGAPERGNTLATAGTLGWIVSYAARGTANVDPERRCRVRGPGAQGWGGRAWGPVGPASWAVASPALLSWAGHRL